MIPASLPLFDEPVAPHAPHPTARRTDPATSHCAAARASVKAGTNRALALQALLRAGSGGLTDFELSDRTGIQQTSIGKRRGELVTLGLVVPTTLTRPSPSGAPAIVWRAVAQE